MNSWLSNYWFFLLRSVALVLNKMLFIPRSTSAHFLFLFPTRKYVSFCVSVQHIKSIYDPMMRHNNNDEVMIASFTGLFSAAWSMTLVCSCPGFQHFLMDDPQWFSDCQPFICTSTSLSPCSVSFPHNPSNVLLIYTSTCAPLQCLLRSQLPSISLHALPVPLSEWLCGFYISVT